MTALYLVLSIAVGAVLETMGLLDQSTGKQDEHDGGHRH